MFSNKTSLLIISILSKIIPYSQGESLLPCFLLLCAKQEYFTVAYGTNVIYCCSKRNIQDH